MACPHDERRREDMAWWTKIRGKQGPAKHPETPDLLPAEMAKVERRKRGERRRGP